MSAYEAGERYAREYWACPCIGCLGSYLGYDGRRAYFFRQAFHDQAKLEIRSNISTGLLNAQSATSSADAQGRSGIATPNLECHGVLRNKYLFLWYKGTMMSYNSQTAQKHEGYEQYLQYIAELDMPIKEKFELLYIVNSILSYFVDQAFGVQTDQITLESIERDSSNSRTTHDALEYHPQNQSADVRSDGVASDNNSPRSIEP